MASTPISRFAYVGGLRLHYVAWGPTRGTPLLLLHDLGETAEQWLPFAAALGQEFRVVAPDLRGHGDSDWIDTYAPQEIGDDGGELLGVLGLIPAAVAGIGLGGLAAALLAARQSYLVDRLVIIDSGVHANLPPERAAEPTRFDLPPSVALPEDWQAAWHTARVRAGLRSERGAEMGNPLRAVRVLRGGRYAPAWDRDGYRAYRDWSPGQRTVSYAEEFHEIDAPTLLVRGAASPILTAAGATATAATIPRCRLNTVANARHDLLHDNPAGLLGAMLPFLHGAD